jgi:hypothetical protein
VAPAVQAAHAVDEQRHPAGAGAPGVDEVDRERVVAADGARERRDQPGRGLEVDVAAQDEHALAIGAGVGDRQRLDRRWHALVSRERARSRGTARLR